MYWDICQFFGFSTASQLTERLMKDYKEGKGYSYYTSGMILFKDLCNKDALVA